MSICPNCASVNLYIHDKGWNRFWRIVTFNSRYVCKDCHSTWKRRSPSKYAKLKRKVKLKKKKSRLEYRLVEADSVLDLNQPEQRSSLIQRWRKENTLFICLDISGTDLLSTQSLGNLMDIYRRLKDADGDLVVKGASLEVQDFLWSLNLSHFLVPKDKICK